MSIRELSLKELRALAQQRLGRRSAELKTRQEMIDALEANERKKVPRLMVPLAAPLPAPVPPVLEKELPPDPLIWTGDSPLPQITARPAVQEFPPERLVWKAQVIVEPGAPVELAPPQDEKKVEWPEPPKKAQQPQPEFSTAEDQPETVTRHFFLEPQRPRLPVTYGDNRVLTFARDPKSLYAAWDFSPDRFDRGSARGQVVNEAGATLQSFAVAGPAGGMFVENLPPGVPLKVEVLGQAGLIGESGWLTLAPESKPDEPEGPVNVASSVV